MALTSCEERGTGIVKHDLDDLGQFAGLWPLGDHVYQPELSLQIRNPQELLLGSAYLPAECFAPVKPVPVLILLAPENGDKFHYFKSGLETIAKEMTISGEIEPMVIFCVSNDQLFGGYFYGNSYPAGNYDNIIGNEMIEYLNNRFPNVIDQASARGIGGVGQGAYGAFRAALKNPGVFSSIAVADGPLDFDGADGASGLMDLFPSVIAEQQSIYTGGVPFDFRRDFDSAAAAPISMMFIGGALAFSPNDTAVDYTRTIDYHNAGTDLDDEVVVIVNSRQSIADASLPGGGDSTTFIQNVVGLESEVRNFDFHLPFDGTGSVYQPIWDMWLANNLETLHDNAGVADPLDGVNMLLITNPHAKWGYDEMTDSWGDFLDAQGYSVERHQYVGTENVGDPNEQFLYDIIREMLVFHSRNFSAGN